MEIFANKQCLYCTISIIFLMTVFVIIKYGVQYEIASTGSIEDPSFKRIVAEDNLKVKYDAHQPMHKRSHECTKFPDNIRFHGQSREDKALFEKFFVKPLHCHGIYVEIGALDGITYSNTLFFEKSLNWTGVLIEGNPDLIGQLERNRPGNVNYGLAVCHEGEKEVLFVTSQDGAVGGALDQMSPHHWKAHFGEDSMVIKVPCKPMGTMLRDAGVTQVDLFSIDVEGGEHLVLETMDWTIPVHVILVEMGHDGEKDDKVRAFLQGQGFRNTLPSWNIMSECESGGDCADNEVFVNDRFPLPAAVSV